MTKDEQIRLLFEITRNTLNLFGDTIAKATVAAPAVKPGPKPKTEPPAPAEPK